MSSSNPYTIIRGIALVFLLSACALGAPELAAQGLRQNLVQIAEQAVVAVDGKYQIDTVEVFDPETYESTYQVIQGPSTELDESPRYADANCPPGDGICSSLNLAARVAEALPAASGGRTAGSMSGRSVRATFEVDEDGAISEVTFESALTPELETALRRALEQTAPWMPGRLDGEPVRATMLLEFIIAR